MADNDEFADYKVLRQYSKEIIANSFECSDGKSYRVLSAKDIFQRYNPFTCPTCLAIGEETPCGKVARKYWDCQERLEKNNNSGDNKKSSPLNDDDNNEKQRHPECTKIMSEEFLPCIKQHAPYYMLRNALIFPQQQDVSAFEQDKNKKRNQSENLRPLRYWLMLQKVNAFKTINKY